MGQAQPIRLWLGVLCYTHWESRCSQCTPSPELGWGMLQGCTGHTAPTGRTGKQWDKQDRQQNKTMADQSLAPSCCLQRVNRRAGRGPGPPVHHTSVLWAVGSQRSFQSAGGHCAISHWAFLETRCQSAEPKCLRDSGSAPLGADSNGCSRWGSPLELSLPFVKSGL